MDEAAPSKADPPGATEEPMAAELRAQIVEGRVFDLIDRRLTQDADGPLAQAFIEAFQDSTVSFGALFATPSLAALQGSRYWQVQRFLVAVIPKLTAVDPLEMTQAVERLVQQGGQDGAAGLPFSALRTWFQADVGRAAALVDRVRTGGAAVSAASLANALIALDDRSLTRDLMQSPATREAAVRALSEMRHDTLDERAIFVEALRTNVAGEDDDGLRGLALDSLVHVYSDVETMLDDDALRLATELLTGAGDATLYRAATLPLCYPKAMSTDLVGALLLALKSVNPEHRGTLDMLDTSLTVLAGDARFLDAATEFVTSVVTVLTPRLPLEVFDGWLRILQAGPPDRFHAVLVDWLLNGNVEARRDLAENLNAGELSGLRLDIDFAPLGLSDPERLIVCMRAIGWFFIHPVTAVSLAVSAVRSASAGLAAELCELIYDPLLLNYGGVVYTCLSEIANTDPAYPHIAPLLARADKYLEDLRSTGILPELHPSEHQRFLERTRFVGEMSKAMKAAEAKSVFANIFPKATILYGHTAVMSFRTPDGQDRHQEIAMQSLSAQHELPRREISDPVGLQWQLFTLKAARLKQ